MLILGPSNSGLKKLINIQKCPSSTKLDHCGMVGKKESLFDFFLRTLRIEKSKGITCVLHNA